MTPNRSTGFTPFFLAYGVEAVLPSDLDHDVPRVKAFDRDRAAEAQQDAVDLLEEAARRPSFAPPATNKPSTDTTKERSEEGYSKLVISYSGGPNQRRKNTSSLHHGKGPIR